MEYDISDEEYDMLPKKFRGGMRRWVEQSIPPGDFLMTLLRGDVRCVLMADEETTPQLRSIVTWCHQFLPAPCWGSQLKLKGWVDSGGTKGIEKMRQESPDAPAVQSASAS